MNKVAIWKIENSVKALNKISACEDLNIKTSYKLLKIINFIQEILKVLNEKRISLYEKYGDKLEDGSLKIKKENETIFIEEYSKLSNEEIETSESINLNEIEKVKISVDDLNLITWLIKE